MLSTLTCNLTRRTLNRQLMDLSSCLDEDIIRTMSVAELQATKPLAAAAHDLKTRMGAREQQLQEQQGVDSIVGSEYVTNSGRFTAPNDMRSVLSSQVRTAQVITPLRTLKNTEQNALAVGGPFHSSDGMDPAAAASEASSIGAYVNKVGDSENAFDKKFEWYLKKFHYCKKSAAWQWCSWHSAASTQAILQSFPQLHIPSIVQREKTSGAHVNELAIVQALSNRNNPASKDMSDTWDSFSVQQSMLSKSLQDAFVAKKRKNFANRRGNNESENSSSSNHANFPRPPSTPSNRTGNRNPVRPLAAANSSLDSSNKEKDESSNIARNRSEESDIVRLLVTKRDLSLLAAVSGRQMIRKVQMISTMITNTTVRKVIPLYVAIGCHVTCKKIFFFQVSDMLEEGAERPPSSLDAEEVAESVFLSNESEQQDDARKGVHHLQRRSVERQAQELHTELSDSFSPCVEPLEKWITSPIGEKYKVRSLSWQNF